MEKHEQQHKSAHETLTQFLDEKAMRKTPERYEILRMVEMTEGIFTVDDLAELMHQHATFQVSRATLFNAMDLLCDAGIVIKHPLTDTSHYELRTDDQPKAYVICRQCNTIRKISARTPRTALQNIRVRYFSREDTLVYIHGLCQSCGTKKRKLAEKRQKSLKQDKQNNGKR